MECRFYSGQKVAYRGGARWRDEYGDPPHGRVPLYGETLTIRAISATGWGVFLSFEELHRADEFEHFWFEPVDERRTDISALKKLLVPARQRQLEDA